MYPSAADDILRLYARLLGRLTGAGAVSLHVPATAGSGGEILIHEGPLTPLPELADAHAAADYRRRIEAAPHDKADTPIVRSVDSNCLLYRVPLRPPTVRERTPVRERRRGGQRSAEADAWLGLRFERPDVLAARRGSDFPWVPDALADGKWLDALLGLGAAIAIHARTESRRLSDRATGLPERSELLAELEAALVDGQITGQAVALVLVGPDDFGWVNERLDRHAGDRVLREIAVRLRAALRSQDHVAHYGGAIFSIVLRDTDAGKARLVAEHAVRRLSEEPYHEQMLRLELSAGLAVADSATRLDADVLVRRADQALSAAKRGEGGNVRVWEAGSDVERAHSLDRLQGIFTGDRAKDYRNMRLLLDTVAAVAASGDAADLARGFTSRLCHTLHACRSAVLDRSSDGSLVLLAGVESAGGAEGAFQLRPHHVAAAEHACRERAVVNRPVGEGSRAVLYAMPLFLQDRCHGAILLEINAVSTAIEGSDRRFLEALASEMAVALDRARLVERERERDREEKERLQANLDDLRRVVGGSRFDYRSSAMESLLARARRVARTDATVLITGESGTGKEMLAHILHELSTRHERPLVVVDCSAISPTLIEAELFGHEKGAFTGAHARNPGRLVQAHGSTVFLDEIGDVPLDLQSKLLRFVQERQFTPVGGVTPRKVDTRILAATNVDLRARVAAGLFRADLFHRLNVVHLHVPALRERKEDILHLARLFLRRFAALHRRRARHFTRAAEGAIEDHAWPGNVRELENIVLASVLLCDAPAVDVGDLQGFQAAAAEGDAATQTRSKPGSSPSSTFVDDRPAADPIMRLRKALGEEIALALRPDGAPVPLGKWLMEDLILAADRLAGGTHRRAAELLGIPETTFRRQLRAALGRRAAGLNVRSASWPAVARVLEDLVRARPPGQDARAWAEAALLAEIEAAAPGNVRLAGALVGVTEATLLRRRAYSRQS